MTTWKLLPARWREASVTTAVLAAGVLAVQAIPAASGNGRGAPGALLFLAIVQGLLSGLTAAGIVLIYRSTRVLNFAQTTLGAGGAVLCFDLLALDNVPLWVAFPIGILFAAGLGAAFDIIFGRRFFRAPRLVLTVFTIVAAGFLSTIGKQIVDTLPIFPVPALRTVEQTSGTESLAPFLPFAHWKFTISLFGNLPLPFRFAHVFDVAVCLAALAALIVFLRYTKLGVAIRALADNSERAQLLGISVFLVSTIVWAVAGALSGLSVTLTGLLATPQSAFGFLPELLLPAFAAAILARMRSLGVAVAAAVGIEVVRQTVQFRQPEDMPLVSIGLLLVVAGGLLLQGREEGRADASVSSTWRAMEEIRPVPKEMRDLTPLRIARWGFIAIVLAVVIAFPFITGTGQTFVGSVIFLNAIVGLSLVVLTGWAGQVSLGQFAFAAIGGAVAAALSVKLGWPFWFAVPAASLVSAGLAVALGIPALRIPGLYLAVATFAFAVAVSDALFSTRFFGWLVPTTPVQRPTLFEFSFDDERAMYFLSLVALVAAIVVVLNLRRGRFGRAVIGIRENEANAEAAAIATVRVKLAAFGLAGLLAGFAGAILVYQERALTASTFSPEASITSFVFAVLGGVSSVWGPLLGSGYINGVNFAFSPLPEVTTLLATLAPLGLLYIAPRGLLSLLIGARDAALRIIAQRNQLIVPSLFADMDPEALHLRLVPLSAPISGSGTQVTSERYRLLTSALASRRGVQTVHRLATGLGALSTNGTDKTLLERSPDELEEVSEP